MIFKGVCIGLGLIGAGLTIMGFALASIEMFPGDGPGGWICGVGIAAAGWGTVGYIGLDLLKDAMKTKRAGGSDG